MQAEPINVVFCIDKGYAQHLAAALASLFFHNEASTLDVFIVASEIDPQDAARLRKVARTFGGHLNFCDMDSERVSHLREHLHLSRGAYYRLFIPDILHDRQRAIYFDCDLVIESNLRDMWAIDLGDHALAGWDERNPGLASRLQLDGDFYINSGVLLLNLEVWRRERLTQACMDWLEANPDKNILLDQDAINAALRGRKLRLDRRWNLNPLSFENHAILKEGLDLLKRHPERVLHFAGPIKPWQKAYDFDLGATYWRYLAMTPWHGEAELEEPKNFGQALSVANQYHRKNDFVAACRYYQAAIRLRVESHKLESMLLLDTINGGHDHFNRRDHHAACEHYRSAVRFWGYPVDHDPNIYNIQGIV